MCRNIKRSSMKHIRFDYNRFKNMFLKSFRYKYAMSSLPIRFSPNFVLSGYFYLFLYAVLKYFVILLLSVRFGSRQKLRNSVIYIYFSNRIKETLYFHVTNLRMTVLLLYLNYSSTIRISFLKLITCRI